MRRKLHNKGRDRSASSVQAGALTPGGKRVGKSRAASTSSTAGKGKPASASSKPGHSDDRRGSRAKTNRSEIIEGNRGSETDAILSRSGKGKVFTAKPQYGKSAPKFSSHGKSSSTVDGSMRINRFISNAGICSRREADTYIAAGVVTVNGKVVTELGAKIMPGDQVNFEGQRLVSEKKVYILLNKPKGYASTVEDSQGERTVMDLIKNASREKVYPVGRLDKDSTGLLMLTNDGELTTRLTHPKYNRKKIYHVHCDKNVIKSDIRKILDGFALEDGFVKADAVSYVDDSDLHQVGIEIHSGKSKIVRRIFAHLGYRVEKLDRVYFCGLTKLNLPRGKWKFLSDKELAMLKMGKF